MGIKSLDNRDDYKLLGYARFCFKSSIVVFFVVLFIEWIADKTLNNITPFVFFLGVFLLSLSGMVNKVTYKPTGSRVEGKGAFLLGLSYFVFSSVILVVLVSSFLESDPPQIYRDYEDYLLGLSWLFILFFQVFLPKAKPPKRYTIEEMIDTIDFKAQRDIAQKAYKTVDSQTMFVWQSMEYVDRDIGGTFFDTCPHCGGEKEYSKGDDDYGDNTEQYVSCNLCGWRGYRRIKYQRYEKEPSTIYKKSILFELKENEPKYHTILKQYFPYKLKTIESFYIDWKNKQVLFKLFTVDDKYTIEILDFKKADELFQALELYNPHFSKKSILNVIF